MQFVFIVGVARSGSKIYRNAVNSCTDIHLLNELHYLTPRWLRNDFRTAVSETLGLPVPKKKIESLLDLMYGGTLEGTFWQFDVAKVDANENCIHELDRKMLASHLAAETDLSLKAILEILMRCHAEHRGKPRGGAKFPVNVACYDALLELFPEAHYVHITRDPRAVYASMMQMDLRGKGPVGPAKRTVLQAKRLAYVVHQFRCAGRIHARMSGRKNYRLFRFEDTILRPQQQMRDFSEYLGVPFDERMLAPPKIDSSYSRKETSPGLDEATLNRWREAVSPPTERTILRLLGRQLGALGYKL